jgi:hypothetical protein
VCVFADEILVGGILAWECNCVFLKADFTYIAVSVQKTSHQKKDSTRHEETFLSFFLTGKTLWFFDLRLILGRPLSVQSLSLTVYHNKDGCRDGIGQKKVPSHSLAVR